MRKNKVYSFLIFGLMIFSACNLKDKINQAFTFNYNQQTSFTIPSNTVVDLPVDIGTPDIESSGKQEFENNNTSASLVDEVLLTSLELNITNPDDRTFSFLKSIKIYIRTNEDNEILLAEETQIPANVGDLLELQTSSENLKTYAAADSYSLRYEVVTRETTNSQTDITANMVFRVNAKLL